MNDNVDSTNDTENECKKNEENDIKYKWIRKCPKCNKEMYYKWEKTLKNAIKNNSNCFGCYPSGKDNILFGVKLSEDVKCKRKEKIKGKNTSFYGKHHSIETKQIIAEKLSGKNHPNYGKHLSEETKEKISKSNKGRKLTSEQILKIIMAKKGKPGHPHSIESKLKIGNAHRGKLVSEETKKKIRISMSGNNHPQYGMHRSEETKRKLRESHTGKKNPMYGVHMTGKNAPMYGKHHNDEVKKRISKSMRLVAIERIKKLKCAGLLPVPSYNPIACEIIDSYGKLHDYNFQHAINGGEYYIKELGYWVDGYDKNKNTVIEYYENRHKQQIEKDEQRKQNIINHLGCKFIEIKEWENDKTK